MKPLFDSISIACSRSITKKYSTSFSMGIRFLNIELRDPIYSIYGFVRVADEIVDSFAGFDQKHLLSQFRDDTVAAIADRISVNPVLNSFQQTVHDFGIERELIEAFLDSMAMDLEDKRYTAELYDRYIFGSAEVVGLMCLRVFCRGDKELYLKLRHPAMKLGAAFQKINFLRDMRADYLGLGRVYFPQVNFDQFHDKEKQAIEADIAKDFAEAREGIRQLPRDARFGVFLAYVYYKGLFRKIRALSSERIQKERIRIPNPQKIALLLSCYVRNNLNLIR